MKKIDEMTLDELADAIIRGAVKQKQCAYCGGEFYAKNATAKYCCDKCRRMYGHEQRKLHCEVCGAPVPYGRSTYCSEKCHLKAANEKRLRTRGKMCEQCGKPLPPHKKRFCSGKCAQKYNYSVPKPLSTSLSTVSTNEKLLSTGRDLVSMAKAAREHGMSYGKYLEMLEKQGEHPAFEHKRGA